MNEPTAQSRKAVRVIVKGRVQGVWYRAHAEKRARELGLSGFVRNLPDGVVEIVAEGESASLDRLVEWTWTGSPHSQVTTVEVEGLPVAGRQPFAARY